jgi:hypothetical protein
MLVFAFCCLGLFELVVFVALVEQSGEFTFNGCGDASERI